MIKSRSRVGQNFCGKVFACDLPSANTNDDKRQRGSLGFRVSDRFA
jgi:hypothetical protein